MKPVLNVYIVRLTSHNYSVDEGRLGVIEEEVGEGAYAVGWLSANHHAGTGSVPVNADDLEVVGVATIPLPTTNPPRRELRDLTTLELLDELGARTKR